MGFSVTSHQSGPVQCEDYRQILNADIVKYLVKSPLQEGRINRYHRL